MTEYPRTDFSKETYTRETPAASANVPPIPPPMPGAPGDEPVASRRGRRWLWLGLLALTGAFAATSWYQIGLLEKLSSRQGEQAEANSQWAAESSSWRERLAAAERSIMAIPATLPDEVKKLRDRMGSVDQRLNAGLEKARKATQEMAASLRGEIRASADEQKRQTEARFQQMDSQRQAETDRAAQLERTVAELNQKLASVSTNLNQVQANVQRVRQDTEKDTVDMRRELQRTGDRVAQVANFNNRPRDRFEVVPGKSQEIAPGIILHISKVDPKYRRYKGWLQLIEDGKILWLRDESMLQTVAFYTGKSALRHDLVVTDMSKPSVAGYLIHPATGETAGSQFAAAPVPARVN